MVERQVRSPAHGRLFFMSPAVTQGYRVETRFEGLGDDAHRIRRHDDPGGERWVVSPRGTNA